MKFIIFAFLVACALADKAYQGNDDQAQPETNPADVVIRTITRGGRARAADSGETFRSYQPVQAPRQVVVRAPVVVARVAPQPQVYSAPQNIQFVQALRQPSYAAPARVLVADRSAEEDLTPKNYAFEYKIDDADFSKQQSHQEAQDGGVVRGSYSVLLPDGVLQIVKYTADPQNGFRAEIEREEGVGPVFLGRREEPTTYASYAAPVVARTEYVAAPAPIQVQRTVQTYSAPVVRDNSAEASGNSFTKISGVGYNVEY